MKHPSNQGGERSVRTLRRLTEPELADLMQPQG
jgi:hypothetical protein